MKKTREIQLNFSFCIQVEVILVALIIISTILGQKTIVSLGVTLGLLVSLGYTLLRIKRKKFDGTTMLLIILASINVILNGLVSVEAQLGFGYFKKLFMFIAFMLMLYYAQEDQISNETRQWLLKIPCLCAMLLVLSYFLGNTVQYGGGITLGFSNPNFTGMWLLHLLIYIFLVVVSPESKVGTRFIGCLFIGAIVWLIILSKARSCYVGLITFAILCVFGILLRPVQMLKQQILVLIVVLPIVLVFIYQYLLNSAWFLDMFSFMVSEGKGLDARLKVWQPALEIVQKNFVFGDYSGVSNGTGVSQLHNTHLDVLGSYGFLPLILFMRQLFVVGKKTILSCTSYFNYCAICGYLAIIVTGGFEAAVVAGSMGMNTLTIGLIVLANYKSE